MNFKVSVHQLRREVMHTKFCSRWVSTLRRNYIRCESFQCTLQCTSLAIFKQSVTHINPNDFFKGVYCLLFYVFMFDGHPWVYLYRTSSARTPSALTALVSTEQERFSNVRIPDGRLSRGRTGNATCLSHFCCKV